MNLFIIPGNPPARYFYERWTDEIRCEVGQCSVYISPYPTLHKCDDSFKYMSDTAAAHAQEFLAFHRSVQGNVILVGHSLGAWMALQLLKEHDPIIEKCFLLYPFLRRPTLRGRFILKLTRHLYRIGKLVLRYRGILERFFKDLKHVTDEELRASLAIIRHEHKVIGLHEGPVQIPEALREKLHMLYCEGDTWCPSHTINELKQWILSEKTDATHGFITSAAERAIVLSRILRMRCPPLRQVQTSI